MDGTVHGRLRPLIQMRTMKQKKAKEDVDETLSEELHFSKCFANVPFMDFVRHVMSRLTAGMPERLSSAMASLRTLNGYYHSAL